MLITQLPEHFSDVEKTILCALVGTNGYEVQVQSEYVSKRIQAVYDSLIVVNELLWPTEVIERIKAQNNGYVPYCLTEKLYARIQWDAIYAYLLYVRSRTMQLAKALASYNIYKPCPVMQFKQSLEAVATRSERLIFDREHIDWNYLYTLIIKKKEQY